MLFVRGMVTNKFHVDYILKMFANDTEKVDGLYCDEDECSSAFLKTGHKHDTFHRLGKILFFKQQLNNFAKIGDYLG